MQQETVTLETLSKLFDINLGTLRKLASQRKIPIVKLGDRVYVNVQKFRDFMNEGEIKPKDNNE